MMHASVKNQQHSQFITSLSWCLIVFTGIGVICSLSSLIALLSEYPSQTLALNSWSSAPISSFLIVHFRTLIIFVCLLFVTGLVASVGLLKRKELARQCVVLLLAISILILQSLLVGQWIWVEQLPAEYIPNVQWLFFLKVSSAAWVVSLSVLAGWIIKRLDEKSTKAEFTKPALVINFTTW